MLRPSKTMRSPRPHRLPTLFTALVLCSACGGPPDADRRSRSERDRPARRDEPPQRREILVDIDAPLDVRALRIFPEAHLGRERICDVVQLGNPKAVDARVARTYPTEAALRRRVRCRGETGSGWADLAFPEPSASLASSVTIGKRLRVKVASEAGGFDDRPVLEFVAIIGEAPESTYDEFVFQPVTNGFNFAIVRNRPDLLGEVRPCAIAYVGTFDAIVREDERSSVAYPRGHTHRVDVVCRHARGEAWVDLAFSVSEAERALAMKRGDVVPLRVVSRRRGRADHPTVTFGPPPRPSREPVEDVGAETSSADGPSNGLTGE